MPGASPEATRAAEAPSQQPPSLPVTPRVQPLVRGALHLEGYDGAADEALDAWIRFHEGSVTRGFHADPSLVLEDQAFSGSEAAERWFGLLVSLHGLPAPVPARTLVAPRSMLTLHRIGQGLLRSIRDRERPLVEELVPQLRAWRANKGRTGVRVESEDVVDFLDEEEITLSVDGRRRLANRVDALEWADQERRWNQELSFTG